MITRRQRIIVAVTLALFASVAAAQFFGIPRRVFAMIVTNTLTVEGIFTAESTSDFQGNIADSTGDLTIADTLAVTGQATFTEISSGGVGAIEIASTATGIMFNETDRAADEKKWRLLGAGGQLRFDTRTDADGAGQEFYTVSRTGTAITAIEQIGVDAWHQSGTYTATVVGCTTSPTVTVEWEKTGEVVTIFVPFVQCTSNLTTFNMTGAPTTIRPVAAASGQFTVFGCANASTNFFGGCGADMGTNGTMNFYNASSGANSWTNSGTKGLATDFESSYTLH